MKDYAFPITRTKVTQDDTKTFDLGDPAERHEYFSYKAGDAVEKIKAYLEHGSFVCFLLGKKNSGKGTYSKLFMETIGKDKVAHISVGDIVRMVHEDYDDPKKKQALYDYLGKIYRGPVSIDEALQALLGRSTTALLPTEIILALVEREIDQMGRKAIFIDGFPRNLDQISYSLYFRSLIGYRSDPDMFVFIDIPETVIDERMQNRVVCPICKTPRSLKLLRTKNVGYDEATKEFYLECDTPDCHGARMVGKEGDELGIEAIRDRLEMDEQVMRQLIDMQGIEKIFLRNAMPVTDAVKAVDDYEITPQYGYAWDPKSRKVVVTEEKWIVPDEDGTPSYSLLAPAVVVSLFKQIAERL